MEKKQLISIFLFLFCISLVSAITIYSGEPVEIELEKPYEYYSIVGNSTEVILDIVQDGNFVTITPNKYSQNDSYEIVFFDSEKETITVYQSSGGGSSTKWKTEYVDRNVTTYLDKEIIEEVPGETIEVEKIVKKIPWWIWGLIIILFIFLILALYLIFQESHIDERGYENNE